MFEISLIIPTFNRRASLEGVLEAICSQTCGLDTFEVIVVDDGSTDDTPQIASKTVPYLLNYIRQKNQGAAEARNRGAREARGRILQFLDDDIQVNPGFLEAVLQDHALAEKVIIVGNLQIPHRENPTVFQKVFEAWTASPPPKVQGEKFTSIPYTECLTGLFSVKNEHFFQVGMLQDIAGDGRVAWGDVDFGYRAKEAGFVLFRAADAIGYHDDFGTQSLKSYASRWERASFVAAKLIQTYPAILPDLTMFEDKTPVSWTRDSISLVFRKYRRKFASSPVFIKAAEGIASTLERKNPDSPALLFLYGFIIGGYIYQGFSKGLVAYPFPEGSHPGTLPVNGAK
jgi:glycosyltransferase involved in cell wall biosynthesis